MAATLSRRRLWLGVFLALLCMTSATSGLAADKAQVAKTMATQASKAYNAGDYQRAVDLYLSAWRTDPQSGYLWALARSEHLAGLLDQAMVHYKAFIADPGLEAARVPKAKDYMADIVNGQVAAKLRDAEYALRNKDYTSAALLCRDALQLAPERFDVLFKLAVIEFAAEHWEEAEQVLNDYLARAPADAPDRRGAEDRLKAVQKKLGKTPPAPARSPEPAPADAKPTAAAPLAAKPAAPAVAPGPGIAARESPSNLAAWAALGGGVALLGGGATVLALLQDDWKAYDAAIAQKNSGGKVTGIAFDDSTAQAASLNQRMGLGIGLVAAGAASAGVGAWLLLRMPGKVAVLPTGQGVVVAVRF